MMCYDDLISMYQLHIKVLQQKLKKMDIQYLVQKAIFLSSSIFQ